MASTVKGKKGRCGDVHKGGGHAWLFGTSLLSISLVTIMGSAVVSPILGEIGKSFPDSSAVEIQMILTIISLTSFVMSFVTGAVCRRGHKKQMLLAGLALFTLGGTGCALATSLPLLLFLRGVFGIGLGMVTPLASSLVVDFYDYSRRTRFLGISQTIAQIGSMLSTMIGGLLAAVNWRYAFLLYGIGAPLLLLSALVLQEPRPSQPAAPGDAQTSAAAVITDLKREQTRMPACAANHKDLLALERSGKGGLYKLAALIPGQIVLLFVINVLFGIIFSSCFANLSMQATRLGIDPSRAGIAISMAAGGGIFGSMLYEPFSRVFHRVSIAILWAVIGVTYLGLMSARSVWMMGGCMLLLGIFGSMLTVSLLSMAGEKATTKVSTQYIGIVQAGSLLGSFLCPFVFSWMGQLFGNGDIGFGFGINGAQALIMALITLLIFTRKGRGTGRGKE